MHGQDGPGHDARKDTYQPRAASASQPKTLEDVIYDRSLATPLQFYTGRSFGEALAVLVSSERSLSMPPCGRVRRLSKPALWPLIIVPIVLPRIVVLAAAPERIVETPATPAKTEVVTARDADIGRPRASDDAALRLVVQRNDELRAIIGLAVQRLVRNYERGPR